MRTLVRVLVILVVIGIVRFLLVGIMRPSAPPAYKPGGPPPAVAVTATDPGLDGRLGDYQALYVRLAYSTTQPVYLNLDGVAAGEAIRREMTGGMYRAQPGSGEAVLWIAFPAGTRLDALRVGILDLREQPVSASDLPVRLEWTAGPVPTASARPDWVARYLDRQRHRAAPAPPNLEAVLGGVLIGGAPLLYVVLQIWFAVAWKDGWRPTALVPLFVAVPAVLWSAYAALDNSNLAFLPIALMAPLGLLYLAIAALLRLAAKRFA